MKTSAVSITLLLTALAALIGGGTVLAGAHGHGPMGFLPLGSGDHQHIGALIQKLGLNEDQHKHLEALHRVMSEGRQSAPEAHAQHLRTFLTRVEGGYIDPLDARQTVDEHLQQMRHQAYQMTDSLVALINSLDSQQRQVLTDHLQEALKSAEGHANANHGGHGHHGTHGHHDNHGDRGTGHDSPSK